uniref:Uncharacterized protein n=1 Tax=Nelumbo nucifera TaxID=4432 RepID=A0A822Y1W5_NELNU|nr:TPA_asm: hypothetical protein HUJ06_025111 [Nelumbo nucifera]
MDMTVADKVLDVVSRHLMCSFIIDEQGKSHQPRSG